MKCDETKPGCQKCQNMGLTCIYSPPQPRKKRKRTVKNQAAVDNTSISETGSAPNPPTTINKTETQIHPSLLDPNNTVPMSAPATTTMLPSQKDINISSDPSTIDYMKKLHQLQQLQQQQAIILSQINSSMMNKRENTPDLQHLINTATAANTTNNNGHNNFNVYSAQEGILLPPLVGNSPVIPNLEPHISSSSVDKITSNLSNVNNNSNNNNIWSNPSLNLTPKTNLQSLGMSMPGSLNNNFSPNKSNSTSLNAMTSSANNIYKSLNNLPNVLSLATSSDNINNNSNNNNNNNTPLPLNTLNVAPGYDQNYFYSESQNLANSKNLNNISSTLANFFGGNNNLLLNGNIDLLPFSRNNSRPNNNNNNRTLKANNAEVALANMQQQEEQQQIASRNNNNNNNTNKEDNNSKRSSDLEENPMNPIKSISDNTTLSNVSNNVMDKDKISPTINTNNKNDDMKPKLGDSQIDYSISNTSSTHSLNGNELQITESTSPMNSSSGEQTPTSSNTIPRLIELSTIAKLNLVDIKLFHHYCTTVWATIIAAGISGPEVWKTYIPNLAFDYPFLMHTILAFSASHLSRTETGLEQYVSSHRLEALKLLREAVLEISEENTDALVASSLILIMDSLANASNTTTSSDSNTSAWIFHVKGAVTILTAVWPLAESSKFYNLISVDLSDLSDVLNQENRTISELVCFDESISDLYPVEIDSPYLITLAYLDQLHREKNQLDFLLRVFAFPALLDRTFLALLMTGDLGAMRIMRSYYKMLRGFTTEVKDRVWFLEGVSQVLPQDVDEYSGGGGMHMMLDFLGGGLPSMTTTNLSEFM